MLLQTPLCGWHESHGGRMVDFAGWKMPVQYASIVDEHLATRRAAGLFDVSHMGRLAVHGPAASAWLESLLTRRVAGIEPGRVRYTLITSDAADTGVAVLDDALVSRDVDAADGTPRLALVVNASNREKVVAWLRTQLPPTGVTLVDRTSDTAMIAVQGPVAIDIVCQLCDPLEAAQIRQLGNYRATTATVAACRVSRISTSSAVPAAATSRSTIAIATDRWSVGEKLPLVTTPTSRSPRHTEWPSRALRFESKASPTRTRPAGWSRRATNRPLPGKLRPSRFTAKSSPIANGSESARSSWP